MPCLPRQPRNSEVVIELRFIVAANYKLGARRGQSGGSNAAWRLPEFSDLTLERFLDGAKECSGHIEGAVSDAERESFMNVGSGLPPPRLFLGVVLATGAGVSASLEGSLVLALPYLGPQQQFGGKILFCLFSACIPIPDPLLSRLLICGASSKDQPQPQQQHEEQHALEKALARVPHLVEGLECCTLKLRPKEGDIMGICCSRVEQISDILFWLLPYRVHIIVFAVDPDAGALDKLISTPPFQSVKGRVFLLPLTGDLESAALKVSGGVGLSKLLVTPSAAEALQHRLQHSTGSNAREPAPRSIMTLLLLSLCPGGSLVSGGLLGGLDEEEEAALLAKSAAVSYYNPEMLAVTQGGSQIHFWVEALAALSEYAENPPGAHEAICFSIQERARAMERLQHTPFAPLCLRVVPSATAH